MNPADGLAQEYGPLIDGLGDTAGRTQLTESRVS
jgi:hypothetical protein